MHTSEGRTQMAFEFPKVFFVSGTDTGVGKTVLSAMLCLGLEAHYWKPIQSGGKDIKGCLQDLNGADPDDFTDSSFMRLAGISPENILPERFRLSQPLSPHLSARLDGINISISDFALPDITSMKHLIIEGAGGLLVPINERELIVDLIAQFDLPVLLAARSGLGTINHTLLSLSALKARKLKTLGVVMIGPSNEENRKAIEQFGSVKVIAQIPILETINRDTLTRCFHEHFSPGESKHETRQADNLAPVHADAQLHSRP